MSGASLYAVRRARPGEFGRWVVVRNGLPNAIVLDGFLTRTGATWAAQRRQERERGEKLYPV